MNVLGTGEIEHHNGKVRVLKVAGDQGFKSFLAGSVPQLESHHLASNRNILGDEIDADGGLSAFEIGIRSWWDRISCGCSGR